MTESLDVGKVKAYLRAFAKERDWEQFHTPKNLVMALAGEAGELTEIFQWLTPEESARIMEDTEKVEAVRQELADVLSRLDTGGPITGGRSLDLSESGGQSRNVF